MNMEENTQLPVEAVECINNWIVTFALAYHKRKDKDISNDAAEFITDELSMPNALTAYATKLYQANETIKVLEYDNNKLKGEVEGLNRWKEEAKAIINPIWEYADTLKVPLGESKTDAVIKHINEAKKLLNEVLVMNEAWGDLPGEFINKVKTFLYGE